MTKESLLQWLLSIDHIIIWRRKIMYAFVFFFICFNNYLDICVTCHFPKCTMSLPTIFVHSFEILGEKKFLPAINNYWPHAQWYLMRDWSSAFSSLCGFSSYYRCKMHNYALSPCQKRHFFNVLWAGNKRTRSTIQVKQTIWYAVYIVKLSF